MEKVWAKFLAENDVQSLEKLVLHYLPLVKVVCGKFFFAGEGLDEEDLRQEGAIGLIQAIQRFDPARGIKFETYATHRIRGCVLDKIRKRMPQSRYFREKLKRVERTIERLSLELGRDAEDEEIATALEMELEEYYNLLAKLQPAVILSLEEQRGENVTLQDHLYDQGKDVETVVWNKQEKNVLQKCFFQLKQKEQHLLTLYYYEDLTMKEIAQVLEVSESRVSQMHTQAILKLRKWVKEQIV